MCNNKNRDSKKSRLGKILLPAFTIAWMVLIFSMSAENGQESSGLSDMVCRWIGRMFVRNFDNLPASEQASFIAGISFFVRKAAHMTEYAILEILILWSFRSYDWKIRVASLTSLFCSFLYACTDELHQRYVGGRAGQFRDVCIDTAGAAAGLLLYLFFFRLVKQRRRINTNIDKKSRFCKINRVEDEQNH